MQYQIEAVCCCLIFFCLKQRKFVVATNGCIKWKLSLLVNRFCICYILREILVKTIKIFCLLN